MISKNEVIIPKRIGAIHHFINLQSDGIFTVNFYFEILDEKNNVVSTQHGDEKDHIADNYYAQLKVVFTKRKQALEAELGATSRCLWRLMDISQNTRTVNLRVTTVDDNGNYKNTHNLADKKNFNADDLDFINDFIDLQRAKITNLALVTNVEAYDKNIALINNLSSKVDNPNKDALTKRVLNYITKNLKR